MKRCSLCTLALLCLPAAAGAAPPETPVVRVGSKKFTEGVILGELAAQLLQSAGVRVIPRRELGGTEVLWQALQAGDIDVYAEYTGTLSQQILHVGADRLEAELAQRGVRMSKSLGFNNSYTLGMQAGVARQRDIRTISDLRQYPDLKFGFSDEFLKRGDGWPGLQNRYGLAGRWVRGMDHDLAYRGLVNGDIQVTDVYETDGAVRRYSLALLTDDLHYFPAYAAVLLYRADLPERVGPEAMASLLRLEGSITEARMTEMNYQAEQQQGGEAQVAADFLRDKFGVAAEVAEPEGLARRLMRLTAEHLLLVGLSLAAAVLVAVPLGVVAARHAALGQGILAVVGFFQTVPSLALLVVLIPLLHIGVLPAVVALFLYSLLPIVRNTYAGLQEIAPSVRESAAALGLPPGARLRLVELPLASRTILAGIKTAAVINVGTATLGAIIGAGGYGQPILTGVRLNSTPLILEGAIPAAVLALVVQGLFEVAERTLTPRGLRLPAA
jgi:osmoprotectant transport system permease protein